MNEAFSLPALFFYLLVAIVVTFIACRRGFFRLPARQEEKRPLLWQVVVAIGALVILNVILAATLQRISSETRLLGMLVGLFLDVVLALGLGVWFLRHRWTRWLKGIGMGMVALIVSLPVVLFVNAFLAALIKWLWGVEEVEQVALQQLSQLARDPWLLTLAIPTFALFVPITEEVLFRGFIQGWLSRKLPRGVSILVTSLLFAFAHYATSQGLGNLVLIGSLFILSLYISWIYERERTLFAPIAFHSVFNLTTVILFLLQN